MIVLKLWVLVLMMRGRQNVMEIRRMATQISMAEPDPICSQRVTAGRSSSHWPTWEKVGLQMTRCLSTAMAMMVSEDMYTDTQGRHFTSLQHDTWQMTWQMTHDACHMTHDAPAEEEVLVSKGPVEPEWVHGGERHGEGGQQVGQRQVRHQDVPDSGARDWGVSTLTSDDDGRFILMSDIKGFKRLCKHQHSPKIPRIYSIKFKIWKVLAEYSDTPGAGPAPVPGAVEVWFPRHERHQADVGHNWKHIQEFVTETEETKTLWMSDWWEDSLSWM